MNWLRLPIASILFALNTLVHVVILLCAALLKAVLPFPTARRALNQALMSLAESWIAVNSWTIRTMTDTRFVVDAPATLQREGHYLVLANHQSWVDIPILQAALNRKVPLLRFFLKSQLFWVPLLGLAWWALDFPFMKRYSRQALARRPELAGRDIEATRRSCAKFKDIPVSVMNFVEGTRFTPAKHARQASPFEHLLKPKGGGVGFVLDAMGDALRSLLDVTVVYPHGSPTFADLFTNRIPLVYVNVRERPIPQELIGGDYENDPQVRVRVQRWINELWREKDAGITQALREFHPTSAKRQNGADMRSNAHRA
ncbi:MAG TPA: acyltransferase [Steroidobacter sp.]|jgi:1-acyl-sn-glycerol-3-phosphate acyltransferase|nr:acyltransferase [Steroidobacter sp.]